MTNIEVLFFVIVVLVIVFPWLLHLLLVVEELMPLRPDGQASIYVYLFKVMAVSHLSFFKLLRYCVSKARNSNLAFALRRLAYSGMQER